nr:MAG TPA_asm: hypothetical protein [Caudoviricetes sp.]
MYTAFLIIFLHRYINLKSSEKCQKSIDLSPVGWYYNIRKRK